MIIYLYLFLRFASCTLIVSCIQDKWIRVAKDVKKGEAGVKWTEEELLMKQDAIQNSKDYTRKQKSLVSRFFSTIVDFGGPELVTLADIMVDEVGGTTRYVPIFFCQMCFICLTFCLL